MRSSRDRDKLLVTLAILDDDGVRKHYLLHYVASASARAAAFHETKDA